MIKKGRVQARDYTDPIGKIFDDLEAEYLNPENSNPAIVSTSLVLQDTLQPPTVQFQ